MAKKYWLLKSEPSVFSIDDLIKAPCQTTHWEGVRNYQARNMIHDEMQVGDLAFFYHSNATPPGIVGTVEIVKAAYPDDTQFEPQSHYYDPKATRNNPRWWRVDVKFKHKFKEIIPLELLKTIPTLSDMSLVQKGNRLSVMRVTEKEWEAILSVSAQPPT